jgi:hypothetical protein
MRRPARPVGMCVVFCLCLIAAQSSLAQVNVTTYHNDNARTGQNTRETTLTTSNVKLGAFGKLFSVALDGQAYAQPLVLSNVSIGGGTHNVVYVATENDTVYAIDANNGTIYWQKSLLLNGGKPVPDGYQINLAFPSWNNNVSPHYGVTGTPVIDPTTNTIYVVASDDESGIVDHRLHALDATSGTEKSGSPVTISGSYGGQTFNGGLEFNRPALLLQGGHVIIAFGQPCDNCTYGWVFSYSASTLAQEAVFSVNPGTAGGTVWMSGDGVAVDSSGNLYLANGNGSYDGADEFGESVMKLGLPSNGSFPILDWFTPNIQEEENSNDWDQGSGGVLILPDLGSGSHPHLLAQVGKTGTIYLLDRTNMGKWCGTVDGGSNTCTDLAVQRILGSGCTSTAGSPCGSSANLAGVWGSPAYWNGNVYFPSTNKESGLGGNVSDYLKAYSFNAGGSGVLSTQPTSHTPEKFSFPGPNPTISSNGTSNGIVWGADNSSSTLYAYNATNLATELYNSNQNPCGSDKLSGVAKFSVPTVANGKVYVGGSSSLTAFGLLTSPDFCFTVTPSSQTISGGSADYTVNVTAVGGFSGTVALSTFCGSGITCEFFPSSISGSGGALFQVNTSGTNPQSWDIMVTATSGTLSKSVFVSLTLQ